MSAELTHKRNTDGLRSHAQEKVRLTHQRVVETIDRLLREGQDVNFRAVAMAAGVAKSYLYDAPDLRGRIEALRAHHDADGQPSPPAPRRSGRTDRSKDVLLQGKDKRIRELETENARLKEELRKLYGKVYEQIV